MTLDFITKGTERRFGVDALPQPLQKDIIGDKERYEKEETRFWVTELVRCLRVAYTDRKYGVTYPPDVRYYFWRGSALHEILEKSIQDTETPILYTFKAGPVELTISGRYDARVANTIIDFKTTSSLYYLKAAPQISHIFEAGTYAAILDLESIQIIYVDMSGTRFNNKKQFFLTYTTPISEEKRDRIIAIMEERAKILYKCLKINQIPPDSPLQEDECKFCILKKYCHKKNGFDIVKYLNENDKK